MGLSNELSCEAGSFSCYLNIHRFLQPGFFLKLYFLALETWIAWSVSLSSCSYWFIHTQMWDHPVHQPAPCHVSSPPQLPVSTPPTSLMNISCLTPWLLDFHTVWFSGSSGNFLFLNLLLSFVWLCEEAKCIYLRLCLEPEVQFSNFLGSKS